MGESVPRRQADGMTLTTEAHPVDATNSIPSPAMVSCGLVGHVERVPALQLVAAQRDDAARAQRDGGARERQRDARGRGIRRHHRQHELGHIGPEHLDARLRPLGFEVAAPAPGGSRAP